MWKKILIVLAAVIVLLVVIIALQPSDYRISRSATIDGAPAEVFPHVNDFHNWQQWSPWAKRDPAAKATFEGPASGTGAIFRWDGNAEVGQGSMTITDSQPPQQVLIKLEFIKPFKDTANTEFTFEPAGEDKTLVTWTMTGKRGFLGKAICLLMDMDKMVGGDFDEGLKNLNEVVTKRTAHQAAE